MQIVKAPKIWKKHSENDISCFLAGSIEMGKAEDWQSKVESFLSKMKNNSNIIVLNPRRDDWDDTWEQSIENDNFREQVEWELKSQEDADLIVLYFDGKSKAPISLLELGLFGKQKNMIVCCPDEFYRKGNVEIVCERYNIPLTNNIEDFLKMIYKYLNKK